MKNLIFAIVTLFTIAFGVSSCSKEKSLDPPTPVAFGSWVSDSFVSTTLSGNAYFNDEVYEKWTISDSSVVIFKRSTTDTLTTTRKVNSYDLVNINIEGYDDLVVDTFYTGSRLNLSLSNSTFKYYFHSI